MATDEEIAAAIDDAVIAALQRGQTVQFNGRTWTSHDLEKLLAARAAYQASTSGSGSRVASYSKGTAT